jgi:hypothetical protein
MTLPLHVGLDDGDLRRVVRTLETALAATRE